MGHGPAEGRERLARHGTWLAAYVALTSLLGLLLVLLDGVYRGRGPLETLVAVWTASAAADVAFVAGTAMAGEAGRRLAARGHAVASIAVAFAAAWATFAVSILLLPRDDTGLGALLPPGWSLAAAAVGLRLALNGGFPGLIFAAVAPVAWEAARDA